MLFRSDKLCRWMGNLSWVQSPPLPVSAVELAVDFEAFAGIRLPGRTFAEKCVQIGSLMRALQETGLLEGRPAFLGRWRQGVCSLRCLGAPQMTGISHRPVLGNETVKILSRLPDCCLSVDWKESVPDYGDKSAAYGQYKLKCTPKALSAAVGKYVHRIKQEREQKRSRPLHATGRTSSSATRSPSVASGSQPIPKIPPHPAAPLDDHRPP